ncbi:DedA family protein [Microbacterium sp. 179-I 3D4 NHS]|uniref:DedA family protein n=1 Tax=Microbacterium sp. 179-I 3D4 NHS TaxID=3142381 RepID=UPI0039A30246
MSHVSPALAASASPEYEGFVGWVLSLIESLGEVGVGLAVLIETFVPPIPSEAILPVAGFLAYDGRMSAWGAWVAATLGGLVGALIWYAIGAAVGRVRTRRIVGRIPLLDHDDFDKAEEFFARWGGGAVLFGRCVPLVRSFISIPAGIERMGLVRFVLYTTVGSAAWNGIWIGLGFAFGPAIRPVLEEWSGLISNLAVGAIGILVLVFILLRIRRRLRETAARAGREREAD